MEISRAIVYNRRGIEGLAMLFDKNIEPRCAYCQWGTPLNEGQIMCSKKGIVACAGSCRRFRYDPLKRTPPKPAAVRFDHLKDEDFIL